MPITVVIADDHGLVREGLQTLLERQPGFTVVGLAHNGRAALELVTKHTPDIAVLDIGMPDLNGIDATRAIRAAVPRVKVIALSMHADRQFVRRMFEAGASGYLLKDCAFEELLRAIQTVMEGNAYISPGIAGVVLDSLMDKEHPAASSGALQLTDRERQTLQLLAEGKTTKEIAGTIGVSVKTVETFRQQIMGKLNLHTVAALTKFAIREGITSVEN